MPAKSDQPRSMQTSARYITVTKADLALLDAGIEALWGQVRSETDVVRIPPGEELMFTPVVEALLYVAIAAVKVYQAFRAGAAIAMSPLEAKVNELLTVKTNLSLEELMKARAALAELLEKGQTKA